MLRDTAHAAIEAVLYDDMPIGVLCDLADELGVDPKIVAQHRGPDMDGWCPVCSGRVRYVTNCGLVVAIADAIGCTPEEIV